MNQDYKIYVDAGRPATLNDGAGVLTDFATLQEAVLAWQQLAPGGSDRRTVIRRKKLSGYITGRSRRDAASDIWPTNTVT